MRKIDEVREELERREETIIPLKALLKGLDLARNKVLKYELALGYNIKEEGLIWIIR